MRRAGICVTVLMAALAMMGASTAAASTNLKLYGSIKGQWRAFHSSADSGLKYRLSNSQGTTSAGTAFLTATSGSLGFVRSAYCEAAAVVTTPNGTMNVRIRSQVQYNGGYGCKNYPFYFRIESGTGSYYDTTGRGTGKLAMVGGDHGTFTIVFNK
jgi:hypothetical protein